ncbi:potassium-transporting ATPase subunit C [Streptomyces sp. XM4193]|uniref:potassium-transporting ATPase subunit C n=1 Tax=Streptomyces sp. XM4193 TaxID=2929782 RepID=UPI001FF79430|nr:potassium-transporting ATPase subunit C [Streptomyces sp. XM4193]MCK1794456.1 potassium-transporting ATPase subunit C [Streptomyces sp. XM4193]
MNTSLHSLGRQVTAALRALLAMTLVTGVLYPLAVTAVAQGLFADRANGSVVSADGREVGSEPIGQTWNIRGSDDPDPRWFQGRPSHSAYDPLATGSGQLGADDPGLVGAVARERGRVAEFNGVPESDVPADAVTGSASAIDPHISPEYARLQAPRVAEANDLTEEQVRALVEEQVTGRSLGFLGEPRVNVLRLNLALKEQAGR